MGTVVFSKKKVPDEYGGHRGRKYIGDSYIRWISIIEHLYKKTTLIPKKL